MRCRLSLLTVLLASFLAGCAGQPPAPVARPDACEDYRQVALVGSGGEMRRLADLLGKRPALVSLWAPWCESCVRELPALERLSREVGPCGASVLGVAVGEDAATITTFARVRGLTYPQFTDEQFRLADALGQRRVPTILVFDDAQQIVYAGGALDGRARGALAGLLGAHAAGAPCAAR